MENLTHSQAKKLFAAIGGLRSDVHVMAERLNAVLASVPRITADAIAANIARRDRQASRLLLGEGICRRHQP